MPIVKASIDELRAEVLHQRQRPHQPEVSVHAGALAARARLSARPPRDARRSSARTPPSQKCLARGLAAPRYLSGARRYER